MVPAPVGTKSIRGRSEIPLAEEESVRRRRTLAFSRGKQRHRENRNSGTWVGWPLKASVAGAWRLMRVRVLGGHEGGSCWVEATSQ